MRIEIWWLPGFWRICARESRLPRGGSFFWTCAKTTTKRAAGMKTESPPGKNCSRWAWKTLPKKSKENKDHVSRRGRRDHGESKEKKITLPFCKTPAF